MNKLSIAQRFTLITVIITLVMLLIGYFVLEHYKTNLQIKVYNSVQNELRSLSELKIKSKFDVGISNAISISNDGLLQNALETGNRQVAIDALSSLSKKMKESTPFKNIKVHIHTKDSHSFLRSWKTNKFGDDLNSFRHSVVKVNKTRNAINTFEVGKAGLSIRSVVPIIKNGVHLGSLEFMQGINSVAKSFNKEGDSFILLMDKNLAVVKVDDSKLLNNYIISQKFINKDFLNDSKNIDFSRLIEDKFLISDKYFYTYVEVKDFNNKKLGIAISAKPINAVYNTIEEASSIIWLALLILVVALLISMIASLFNMKNNILAPLANLKSSIDKIKENKELNNTRIKTTSNDEIAELVNSFNLYLDSIEEGLKKDKEVIYEIGRAHV